MVITSALILAHFKRHEILDHFIDFVDPEHESFSENVVWEVDRVPGLLGDLRSRSRGGRVKSLFELAQRGEPPPTSRPLVHTWLSICRERGPAMVDLIGASNGKWKRQSSSDDEHKQRFVERSTDGHAKRPYEVNADIKIFSKLTNPGNRRFDPEFTQQMRLLRPDWFAADRVLGYKKAIEALLADPTSSRPPPGTLLGKRLAGYLNRTANQYDPHLADLVKTVRPDWLMNTKKQQTAFYKRQFLEEAARTGSPRPSHSTQLGARFFSYLQKASFSYDAEFRASMERVRPDWLPHPAAAAQPVTPRKISQTREEDA